MGSGCLTSKTLKSNSRCDMPKAKTKPKFDKLVKAELAAARKGHDPINSLHEGFAVLLEEVDEFKEHVWKRRSKRDPAKILAELVQVGAMAQRIAEDLLLA